MRYQCPCCGNYTFHEKLDNTYNICPVCYWEDDKLQNEDENYKGGANKVSLKEARANYLEFGASEKGFAKYVRKPLLEEATAFSKLKIGVISDTHGMLRKEVLKKLKNADVIIHAGDVIWWENIDMLEEIAPVYVVRGNNDFYSSSPDSLSLKFAGFTFYVAHICSRPSDNYAGFDFVICGHTHEYKVEQFGNTVYVNPGSCGPERFGSEATMCILELDEEKHDYKITRINL